MVTLKRRLFPLSYLVYDISLSFPVSASLFPHGIDISSLFLLPLIIAQSLRHDDPSPAIHLVRVITTVPTNIANIVANVQISSAKPVSRAISVVEHVY